MEIVSINIFNKIYYFRKININGKTIEKKRKTSLEQPISIPNKSQFSKINPKNNKNQIYLDNNESFLNHIFSKTFPKYPECNNSQKVLGIVLNLLLIIHIKV